MKKVLREKVSMIIKNVIYSRNVSFLFKYNFFRAKNLKEKKKSESKARIVDFRLDFYGTMLERFLHYCFPKLFSNLLVFVVHKIDND